MKNIACFAFLFLFLLAACQAPKPADQIVSYTMDPKKQNLRFFWKNDSAILYQSLDRLKKQVETKKHKLVFATNGGMYDENFNPVGLFIQNHQVHKHLNTTTGKGNFYLEPSGVFYTTDNKTAVVCATKDFKHDSTITNATQSGPMLLHQGKIHPAFHRDSKNKTIRNGVGILPDGKAIFAITTEPMNFYDFAGYFKALGCKEALFLDGAISKMYLPQKGLTPEDGNFSVILAIIE